MAKVLGSEFQPFYRQVMDLLNVVETKRQEMAQNPEYRSDPEKRTEMQRCEGRVIHCKSRLAIAVEENIKKSKKLTHIFFQIRVKIIILKI